MAKLVLVPHVRGSRSLRSLAATISEQLRYKVFRVRESAIRNRLPLRFKQGLDKLSQLTRFKENNISCPEFTTDVSEARRWITSDNAIVVCRTLLRASEGRGIVIAENIDQLVRAPLYVRYVKKKAEYRVHVLNGEIIDVQQKKRRRGFEGERNTKIRNLANGYVFCRENLQEPLLLRETALAAVAAVGYTLGAVDIVFNERENKVYVLEVNASPGLTGTTLQTYSNAITNWVRNQNAV